MTARDRWEQRTCCCRHPNAYRCAEWRCGDDGGGPCDCYCHDRDEDDEDDDDELVSLGIAVQKAMTRIIERQEAAEFIGAIP